MNSTKILSFAIGPIGAAFLGFISLPIVTWFYSQEDVGRISMLQTVIGFATLFFTLGLDQLYVRDFHDSGNKAQLFRNCVFPSLLFCLLFISFIGLTTSESISELLFDIDDPHVSLMVILCVISALMTRFLSLILRMQENGIAYSLSQLLPKCIYLTTIGIYVLVGDKFNFFYLVLANTLSILSVCLFFLISTRNEWIMSVKTPFYISNLKKNLGFGLPLIPAALAFWGLTALDRVFLKSMSSYEELGLYSVSVSFAAAASIFQSIFSVLWAPTVYKWVAKKEGLEKIPEITNIVTFAVVIIFSLVGAFSWLVDFILPENYSAAKYILVTCMGFPLLYTLSETTGIGIGIAKRTIFAMIVSVIALLVNLIGNYFLVPILGAKGAAISTAISFVVFFVLKTEISCYLWSNQPRMKMYCFVLSSITLSMLTTLYGEELGIVVHLFWLVFLCASLWAYKTLVFESVKWLRSKIIKRAL